MLTEWIKILLTNQSTTKIIYKIILVLIPNGEDWHYPAVEKVYALIKVITSW